MIALFTQGHILSKYTKYTKKPYDKCLHVVLLHVYSAPIIGVTFVGHLLQPKDKAPSKSWPECFRKQWARRRPIRVIFMKDRIVSPAKCIQNVYHDIIILAFSPQNLARSMWKFVLVAVR